MNELGTTICNICIMVMKDVSTYWGISYGLVNVLLFIVFQPLCILFFFISSVTHNIIKRIFFSCGIFIMVMEIIFLLGSLVN